MRTLIFSDTHLTARFDEPTFRFLAGLFKKFDRIIINGDFWDGYETNFTAFTRSPWQKLFPILRKKKAIYVYGNHDKQKWTKNPELFSETQLNHFLIKVGKYQLVVEHGHRICPSFDIIFPRLAYTLSIFFSSKRFPLNNKYRAWENRQMKAYARDHLKRNHILVCGHSHIPENSFHDRYLNSGMIQDGIAQYIAIEDDQITLMSTTYT